MIRRLFKGVCEALAMFLQQIRRQGVWREVAHVARLVTCLYLAAKSRTDEREDQLVLLRPAVHTYQPLGARYDSCLFGNLTQDGAPGRLGWLDRATRLPPEIAIPA